MLPQLTLLLMHIMKGYVNVLAKSENARTLPALKHLDSTMSDCSSGMWDSKWQSLQFVGQDMVVRCP